MADTFYYLKGKAFWAKIKNPDVTYECYSIDLSMDEDSMILFKDSGLQLKVKENEAQGEYIRLRRAMTKNTKKNGVVDMGPPQVLLKDGENYKPFDGLIGNGSDVVCKVRVYDTARGKGHELAVVAIDNLVEYEGTAAVGGEDLPF